MKKTRFFYILIILCLPLLAAAQQDVSNENQDSSVAAVYGNAGNVSDTSYVDEVEVPGSDATATPVGEHHLWDQDEPAMADTMDSYADHPLVIRHLPDSIRKVLSEDKQLQYTLKKKEEEKPRGNSFGQSLLYGLAQLIGMFSRIILFVVIACVAVLLFRYLKQNGYLNRKSGDDKDIEVKLSEEELDTDTYQQQIEQAISAGKLRLAVRLLYLQTLRVLVDKELITYSREKTNAAYLRSLAPQPWYKQFATLTLDYEYIWYGEMPVNNEQFNVIHRQFRQFMNELGYTR